MSKLRLTKPEEIEIYLDPFHSKILRTIKNENRPMTVKEIAAALGQSPAMVHYHVKKLESIGVLFINYTKIVNGIVAKYYDQVESVALELPDGDEGTDLLRAKMMSEYGGCFDDAKRKFLDLYNVEGHADEKSVYLSTNDSFPVDRDRADAFFSDLKAVMRKYRSEKENAARYTFFLAMIENRDKK